MRTDYVYINHSIICSSTNREFAYIFIYNICECSKKKKLSIYGIFGSLTMLDKQDFRLGGDVLNWYYNGVMDRDTLGASTRLHVSKDIAEEMINFDRNVLKDISKKDIQLGLRDYITNMAQPASIWKTAFEFPRLNSWNIEAKKEMFVEPREPFRWLYFERIF